MENLEKQLLPLIENIEQWAEDSNLIQGSSPQKQLFKLAEEAGELFTGYNKNNRELMKDSIGDNMVVVLIIRKQISLTPINVLMEDVFEAYSLTDLIKEKAESYAITSLNFILKWIGDWAYCMEDISNKATDHAGILMYNLASFALSQNLDPIDCLAHAYDQIKDRKGKMINGVFVKEEDL